MTIEDLIAKHADQIGWDNYFLIKKIQPVQMEDWIFEEFSYKWGWHYISESHLSESFIEKWKDKINWKTVSIYQNLSENFIEKWKDKIYWKSVPCNQSFSETFIEKWIDKFSFNSTFYMNQTLSEDFIEKYLKKLTHGWGDRAFDFFVGTQNLSQSFIRKYKDRFPNWGNLVGKQKLSEEFIEENHDRVPWNYVLEDQELSNSFIEKWKHKLFPKTKKFQNEN